jgi:hypothetical protein
VLSWHDVTTILLFTYKFKYFFSSKNFEVGGPLVIPTSDKATSYHGPILPSSPLLFSNYVSNPSNANHIEVIPMFLSGLSPSAENDKPIQPKVGIKKKNYDATKKFQEKWATKFPWEKCL